MPTYGIYVHSSSGIPYAEAIIQGIKPIETRSRDTLGHLVGQRVLLIRTRSGHEADVIGDILISGKTFRTASELENMRDLTLIPPGSKFDCHGNGKWCYTVSEPHRYEWVKPLSDYTVIRRTMSWALLEDNTL